MSIMNTVMLTPASGGHEILDLPESPAHAAVKEAQDLWTKTVTSINGVRARQYDFLGAIYERALQISSNPAQLEKLRTSLWVWVRSPGKHVAKRIARAGAPEILLAAAMGFDDVHRSLRSKYKRALGAAERAGVAATRESFHEWLRHVGGIVKVLGKDPLLNYPSDAPRTPSGAARRSPRRSERKAAMNAIRCALLTKSVDGMSPIPMIGNAPPADTFVAVVYRVEASCLVPCLWSDATADIDALLQGALRREDPACHPPAAASNDLMCPPAHAKEAA